LKRIALIIGPALGILTPLLVDIPQFPNASTMMGIVLWMAIWWISECVPLPVTALIPLIAYPLTGIATAKEVSPRYMTSIMFLFVGGFLIAQAMERTGLHRRIALQILSRWHASPLQILAGFACVTAFLSMWISNTATTMLMATIGIAVLKRLDQELDASRLTLFAPILLLIIAYSANIGGMGTPVGTIPNLVLLENMNIIDPQLRPSFLQWMMVGIPIVVLGIGILIAIFAWKVRTLEWDHTAGTTLKQEHLALGKMGRDEKLVGWVLGLTALAWMTRTGIKFDSFAIPGWSSLLPYGGVDDGTVAITGAISLFLLPGKENKPILGYDAFSKLPWGILILLGGGFALAMGMQKSELSLWIGQQLEFFADVPLFVMLIGIALMMTFLTEITSNTAITQVMLPVLAAVAVSSQHDVTMLLLTATLTASCAFMLPTATPPNAIVFGTERIPMTTMVKTGLKLNFILPLIIVMMVFLLRPLLPT